MPVLFSRDSKLITIKQIWIYDNNQGIRTARIFEYVYETKNDFKNNLKNFSGVLIVRDLDGKFLGGLKIKKNHIEGLISEITTENGKKEVIQPKKEARTNVFLCGPAVVCKNWTISAGMASWTGANCDADYQCWWGNTNELDPAFTGFIHTHPIENGYDYHNPSPTDRANANMWSESASNYILTEQRLIKYSASGAAQKISTNCL